MGMGFNVITSPDLLTAPPPGLQSCSQTSVNPADAQVCTLVSDMEVETEPHVMTEPPMTEAPNVTEVPTLDLAPGGDLDSLQDMLEGNATAIPPEEEDSVVVIGNATDDNTTINAEAEVMEATTGEAPVVDESLEEKSSAVGMVASTLPAALVCVGLLFV
jgi:hypothetical protein